LRCPQKAEAGWLLRLEILLPVPGEGLVFIEESEESRGTPAAGRLKLFNWLAVYKTGKVLVKNILPFAAVFAVLCFESPGSVL
jgi:hypothetical protein